MEGGVTVWRWVPGDLVWNSLWTPVPPSEGVPVFTPPLEYVSFFSLKGLCAKGTFSKKRRTPFLSFKILTLSSIFFRQRGVVYFGRSTKNKNVVQRYLPIYPFESTKGNRLAPKPFFIQGKRQTYNKFKTTNRDQNY